MAKKQTPEELLAIFRAVKPLLQRYEPPLTAHADVEGNYDLWSHKEVIAFGQKRSEMYFASLVVKSNYVGFYFMPIYAEPDQKNLLDPALLKLLKGKTCFHLQHIDATLLTHIESALAVGFRQYQERGWV
ncbi:MAG: hypothetical protein U0Y10_20540 [Spirosomataceae bacterium]